MKTLAAMTFTFLPHQKERPMDGRRSLPGVPPDFNQDKVGFR
jgi:hypothetical protein